LAECAASSIRPRRRSGLAGTSKLEFESTLEKRGATRTAASFGSKLTKGGELADGRRVVHTGATIAAKPGLEHAALGHRLYAVARHVEEEGGFGFGDQIFHTSIIAE
jgi:hypothetical protein